MPKSIDYAHIEPASADTGERDTSSAKSTDSAAANKRHHTVENANEPQSNDDDDDTNPVSRYIRQWVAEHRFLWHLFWWLLVTAYWVALLVVNHEGALITSLLWAFVTGLFFFAHVPTTIVTKPLCVVFDTLVTRPASRFSSRARLIGGAVLVVAIVVVVSMASPETELGKRPARLQSLFGILVFGGLVWISSVNRSAIKWRIPIVGLLLQFLLGVFITKSKAGYDIFRWLADQAATLLGYSSAGTTFVFGETVAKSGVVAVSVFPPILFFSTLINMLYYVSAIQWLITKFAWFMVRVMDTSGSESVVAAASPFVGQGESALLVQPFVEHLTDSEIHSVMTSGFSTIAGSVLGGYISMGVDAQVLITSCVMSVPCSLAMSKLRIPETKHSLTKGRVVIPKQDRGEINILHSAGNGAAQGLKLVGLIMAALIAFTSLLALINGLLGYFGGLLGKPDLTLEFILRYPMIIFAWLVGVPGDDVLIVGELLGTKLVASEFLAYMKYSNKDHGYKPLLTKRGAKLTEYALAGFANFTSTGIQIGTLGAIAPTRKRDFARLVFSAMLVGGLSTLTSAAIAGLLI
ncbi:hypothetical protein GQ42DRAFT_160845 [Ramicandelaber brevisporus]|nr:hypothetical protein GQ42DRAFT_160845 [Ramicandelaber brevisporus]